MKKKGLIGLFVILVLSTLLKVWWINNIPLSPVFDFETLYRVAVNLYSGERFTLNGYPWAFQSYGYPLILSIFFRMAGSTSVFTAKIFNVICSTMTLPVIYMIFKKVFKSNFVLWTCFTVFAFLPNNLIYTNVLGTEVLAVLLFSTVICMNLYINDKNKNYNMVLQGIIIGVLSLVKPFFMAYPVVLIFIYLMKYKKLKRTTIVGICLICGFMIVMVPSLIKNYRQFGKAFPVSYNGGYVLYINNNSQNVRGSWMDAYKVEATNEFKEELREKTGYEYDVDHETEKTQILRNAYVGDLLKKQAVKWIFTHPKEFITLGFLRLTNVFFDGASDVQLWGFENLGDMTSQQNRQFKVFISISDAIIFAISFAFLSLFLINFKKMFLKKTNLSFLLVMWSVAFFYAVHFVFEGQARYNFPTLFLLIICFGWVMELVINNQHWNEEGDKSDVGKRTKQKDKYRNGTHRFL